MATAGSGPYLTVPGSPQSQSTSPAGYASSSIHSSLAGARLLVPFLTPPRVSRSSRTHRHKGSASKLVRSRPGSISLPPGSPTPVVPAAPSVASYLLGCDCKVEIAEQALQVQGYQIYAVEKWIVERTRSVTLLVVYTGDPNHQITVTALAPDSTLSHAEASVEWSKAMQALRKDGARPRESDKGILMVTSLANFRSDYTIVHIPSGNFMDAREKLYTNIDLMRMGCSGRSALTLEEPSDSTKDRFIDMYQLQDKTRSNDLLRTTVLELVRFIQAGLTICGFFNMPTEQRNGLLCDVTVEGIQHWITDIGEPCLGVERSERVADPTVVAALLSSVLATRNRLCALGYQHAMPKDPFLDPQQFCAGLAHFQQGSKSPSPDPSKETSVPLTRSLFQSINTAYEKVRQTEAFKVHKVLLNKLDDLATDLRRDVDSSSKLTSNSAVLDATPDLRTFVQNLLGGGKDGAGSLRYLWTARPGHVGARRKEKEHDQSDGEADGEKERAEGGEDEDGEALTGLPWSGRMQRKIEAWAGLGRSKKQSLDMSNLPRGASSQSPVTPARARAPAVVISHDDDEEEVLSSGQVSPISGPANNMLRVGSQASSGHASSISEYDRKVTEFNRKRPITKPAYQGRITSWSDPLTARTLVKDDGAGTRTSKLRDSSQPDAEGSVEGLASAEETLPLHSRLRHGPRRCLSFNDVSSYRNKRVLSPDRMRIDVELCAQLLIMRRREEHLHNVIACIEALGASLSKTNAALREDYQAHQAILAELEGRSELMAEIENERTQAELTMQETNALCYESEQFRMGELWRVADPPRQKVLALRGKVFGTARRLPPGVHGAHGRFNRLQWTLDGSGRLVDWMGRTESDVEEEEGLPEAVPDEEEEDVVENRAMKPMWLLRFFTSWGARWGRATVKEEGEAERKQDAGADQDLTEAQLS